jgi:putative protease
MVFNVPEEPIDELVSRYREALEAVARRAKPDVAGVRGVLGGAFTRGHFARAV